MERGRFPLNGSSGQGRLHRARSVSLLIGSALLALAGAGSALADGSEEVVVVYNRNVPESREIADHYAAMRQVPAGQIFGFAISTNEEISRVEFRDHLQLPLAAALEKNQLWRIGPVTIPAVSNQASHVEQRVVESRIRYAVLCYGVPLRIAHDPSLKEEGAELVRVELRRNEAAVDSELALLPLLQAKPPLFGPLRNPAYTTTNAAMLHPTNGLLMVSRLDGPTATIASNLVDKAIQAETDGLWGRAYFDLRKTTEPNLKLGEDWIRGAAEIARHLGFETVVEETPATFPAGFPMSHIAFYAGWYTDSVSGPFAAPTVEFMPGAFAYHIHSFSAASLRTASHYWAGPLLAKGATITMGCVSEPYLSGSPDIGVFTARLLFHGFTFGEAAYASQSVLSWQTTVVGDPLYRPFGKSPELRQVELTRRQSKLLEWSWLRLANLNMANGRPMADWVAFLEELELRKGSSVLTEKLADLYSAQGKPSSAVYTYNQALKLDCSPQQRIRLLLTLGEKLVALNRRTEAAECYRRLLKEFPDYPDKAAVEARLLTLTGPPNKK